MTLCWLLATQQVTAQISQPSAPTPPQLINQLQEQAKLIRTLRAKLLIEEWDGEQWVRSEQTLLFQAPDKLRVEGREADLTLIASGNDSILFEPATLLARRWDRNLIYDWLPTVGGPANVAAFGHGWQQILKSYRPEGVNLVKVGSALTYQLRLIQSQPKPRLVKDFVKAGTMGIAYHYAVFKQPFLRQPFRIYLYFDTKTLALVRWSAFDQGDRLLGIAETVSTTCLESQQSAVGSQPSAVSIWFPTDFRVSDASNTVVKRYRYTDLEINVSIDKAAFTPKPPSEFVTVDAELKPLTAYRARRDVGSRLSEALVLWQHTEDADAALQKLDEVAHLAPNSPLPYFYASQIYLQARRYENAESALKNLLLRKPDFPSAPLMLADVLQAQGEFGEAIELLQAKHPNEQRAVSSEPLATRHSQLATYLARLGDLHRLSGDFTAAAYFYRRALFSAQPGETDAALNSAERLFALAYADGTIEKLHTDLSSAPGVEDNPFAQVLLMWLKLELSQPKAALKHLRQAERLAPDNLPLRFRMASLLEAYSLDREAELSYSTIASLHPASKEAAPARESLAAEALRREDYNELLRLLSNALEFTSSLSRKIQVLSGFHDIFARHFRRGDLVAFLEAALQEEQLQREEFYWLLAELYRQAGESLRAIETLRKGTAKFPRSPLLGSKLFDLLVEEAQRQGSARPASSPVRRPSAARRVTLLDAQKEIDRLIQVHPNQPYFLAQRAWLAHRRALEAGGVDTPSGRQFYQLEQQTGAELVRKFPDDPDSHVVWAVATFNYPAVRGFGTVDVTPRVEQALQMGTPEDDRHDEVTFIRQFLASVYGARGREGDSRRQYQLLIAAARSEEERATYQLALLSREFLGAQTGKFGRALRLLRDILASYTSYDAKRQAFDFTRFLFAPPSPDAKRAEREAAEARIESLLSEAEAFDKANPNDPYAKQILAEFYLAAGEEREGLSVYSEAARLVSKDADLLEALGDVHRRLDQPKHAMQLYRQVIAIDPERRRAYDKLITLLMEGGDKREAWQVALTLIRHSPWDARLLFLLGNLRLELGEAKEAVPLLERAVKLATYDTAVPIHRLAHFHLTFARALEEGGEKEKAIREYESLTRPEVPQDIQQKATEALERLRGN